MKIKNLIVFFIILLFPLVASSKEIDYVVKNIAVNETSTNATRARKNALLKGQKQAFDILLDRMDISKENALWISDEEIEKMVSSIKISKEKIAKDNYSAILDITFDKEFTKFIFNKHNINSQTEVKNKYLVIPVVTKNDQVYIWETENIWLKPWQKSIKERGIKSIVVPEKDIDSLASINKDVITFDSYDDFVYLTNYYDVNSIIIANAEHIEEKQKIEIMFTKISPSKKSKVKLNFYSNDDLDTKTLFTNATDKTIDYIINSENMDSTGIRKREGMIVKVSISGLEDYLKIDKIMRQLEFLDSVELNYLSKKIAEYHITYSMDDYSVLTRFEDYGFFIKEKEDGYYLFLKSKYNLGALL